MWVYLPIGRLPCGVRGLHGLHGLQQPGKRPSLGDRSVSTPALGIRKHGTLFGQSLLAGDEDYEAERLRKARDRAMMARQMLAENGDDAAEAVSQFDLHPLG